MPTLPRAAARAAVLLATLPFVAAAPPASAMGCAAVVHVAAGYLHVAAVQNDGTVWTWGTNPYGQLGDGTFTDKQQPVQVLAPAGTSGFLTGVTKVAAGVSHTLAVKSNGTVWAWGSNMGLFGNGGTAGSTQPVQSSISNVVQVAAGQHHSLALTSSGDVYAWGYNHSGQLGFSPTSTTPTTTPLLVSGLSNIVEIAASDYHSLARRDDGTVFGWGFNFYGQATGFPSASMVTTPTAVPVTAVSGVQSSPAIAAGGGHSIVRSATGNPIAFGRNDFDQVGQGLGGGGFTVATPPSSSLLQAVSTVGAAYVTSYAVSAGTTFGWGSNTSGELGDPSGGSRPHPAPVPGASPAQLVTGGYGYAVALIGGTVFTWGSDSFGQLGNGPLLGARTTPAPATCT